jgi:hypothetical protein
MSQYGYSDASMTNGLVFKIGARSHGGLFGLFDNAPPVIPPCVTREHITARRRWPSGAAGRQISWSGHGGIHILRLETGLEIAVWRHETRPDPVQAQALHAAAFPKK